MLAFIDIKKKKLKPRSHGVTDEIEELTFLKSIVFLHPSCSVFELD